MDNLLIHGELYCLHLGILFCVGIFKVGPNAHGEKIISENCIPVRSITMLISEIDTTNHVLFTFLSQS